MNLHEAIFELNPTVVTIRGDIAYDANENEVNYDKTAVSELIQANLYKVSRASAYPSWQDQLDNIFHNGIDAWKADIQAIKDQFPKP